MTDEEVICEFMEPRPTCLEDFHGNGTRGGTEFEGYEFGLPISAEAWWWSEGTSPFAESKVRNRYLTLDLLHEVEKRLIESASIPIYESRNPTGNNAANWCYGT